MSYNGVLGPMSVCPNNELVTSYLVRADPVDDNDPVIDFRMSGRIRNENLFGSFFFLKIAIVNNCNDIPSFRIRH